MADYKTKKITDISVSFLKNKGISFLILDVDNTLGTYKENQPSQEIIAWAKELSANGINFYIASNNRKEKRVKTYADLLGARYKCGCMKPLISSLNCILWESGYIDKKETVAIIGDQVFTDTLAGKLCGITTILVKPIKLSNPLMFIRYLIELPFRWGTKI